MDEVDQPNDITRYLTKMRRRIVVHRRAVRLTTPLTRIRPLAQRVISGKRLVPFEAPLQRLRQRHQVRVRYYQPAGPSIAPSVLWIALPLALPAAAFFRYGTLWGHWETWLGVALAAAARSRSGSYPRRPSGGANGRVARRLGRR